MWLIAAIPAGIVWSLILMIGMRWGSAHQIPHTTDTDCQWVDVKYIDPGLNNQTLKYHHCVRPYTDFVSTAIAESKVYPDCLMLSSLWSRVSEFSDDGEREVFVDVGANIGACTMFMASHGIRTISFEPNPSNLFYLRHSVNQNFHISPFVSIVGVGLGDVDRKFNIYSQNGNFGNSVINVPVQTAPDAKFSIKTKLMDDMLQHVRNIPVLKIDAQGFELKVLQGARNILSKKIIKVIKLEVAYLWLKAQGAKLEDLHDILVENGYKLFSEQMEVMPREEFCRRDENNYYDVYAVLEELADKVFPGPPLNAQYHPSSKLNDRNIGNW